MNAPGLSVVLLAAGYGTRLYPLTKDRPKALLPLGRDTILDIIVQAVEAVPNVSRTILVTNHPFAHPFRRWRARRSSSVEILDDRTATPETRLGAIRDLQLAWERRAAGDDVLVVGTDNLLTASLAEIVRLARARRTAATVAVRTVKTLQDARQFGVAETNSDGRIVRWWEKPRRPPCRTIGLCLYYFPNPIRRQIQVYLAQGGSGDAPGQFLEWLVARHPVYAVMTRGAWFDIGSQEAYDQAIQYWKEHERKGAAHA